jgi:hypothetical protein
MNKQTKAYRKLGLSTKVNGNSIIFKNFEIYKGSKCLTDFKKRESNSQNNRKSPWTGSKKNKFEE